MMIVPVLAGGLELCHLNATTLTGAFAMSAGSDGAYGGRYGNRWNNALNGGAFYLFINNGSSFINSPASGNVAPNLILSPGIYGFQIYGENVSPVDPYNALNLFFNGNNANPRISVFGADGSNSFLPNSASTLANVPSFQRVAGSGSSSFIDGDLRISLTAYTWSYPRPGNTVDRVSADNVFPNGVPDSFGRFTLEVTDLTTPVPPEPAPIPEPSSILLGSGGLAFAFIVRTWINRPR